MNIRSKFIATALALISLITISHPVTAAVETGCLSCHNGIESIRQESSAMLQMIKSLVDFQGPQTFYPDPGAMDINKFTCGQAACHKGYEERLEKALMNTEAGKIQGNLHTWVYPRFKTTRCPGATMTSRTATARYPRSAATPTRNTWET